MGHKCHARGCGQPVPPEMLMCLRHWRKVPHVVQLAVWRHYRPGQCKDKRPSAEWMRAAGAAIAAVAIKERQPITITEHGDLESFQDIRGHEGDIFDLLVLHERAGQAHRQGRLFK